MSKVLFKMRMMGAELMQEDPPWEKTFGDFMQHHGITRNDFESCTVFLHYEKGIDITVYDLLAWVRMGRPNLQDGQEVHQ